jgi:quercetin dioxygenase-like cupin family protein
MKNKRKNANPRIISALVFIVLCLPFLSSIAMATQPVLEGSEININLKPKREVVLENEQVQVVRLTYPVGTESGMHNHAFANRVVYFVKGGTLTLVPKDTNKPSKTLTAVDGQTLFLPATTHNVKNIGNTEIVIVETELK